jgi:hypothetical protein
LAVQPQSLEARESEQFATRFEFVIDLRTAKTLRLAIPQSLPQRRDEIVHP